MCTRIEHHLPRGQVLRAGLAFYPGPSQVFSTSTSHLSSGPSFPCNVSSPLHLLDLSHFSRSGSGISWTILAAYLSGRTGPQRPHTGSGGHSQAAGNQRRVLARRYHNPKAAAKILWQPPGHLATWRGGGKAGQHPTMLIYLTPSHTQAFMEAMEATVFGNYSQVCHQGSWGVARENGAAFLSTMASGPDG